jgi:hypothetical protein
VRPAVYATGVGVRLGRRRVLAALVRALAQCVAYVPRRATPTGAPEQVRTGAELARHHRAHVDGLRHRGAPVVLPTRRSSEDPHA